jgi:hypothetical protein
MCGSHAKAKSVEYFMLFYGISEKLAGKKHKKYHKLIKADNLPSTLGYWINNGYSKAEAKLKVSESQAKTSLDAFIKKYGKIEGKKKYAELCLRKSIQYSNEGNPRFGVALSRELKGKISKATRESLQSSDVKENFIKRFLKPNALASSDVELKFGKILRKFGLSIQEQFPLAVTEEHVWSNKLSNKIAYVYDYKVVGRKVLIEVHGDYIHANPKMFTADMKINYFGGSFKAADKWVKDSLKSEYAKSNGYKLFVVWESDDLLAKAEQIISYLKNHSPKRKKRNAITKD